MSSITSPPTKNKIKSIVVKKIEEVKEHEDRRFIRITFEDGTVAEAAEGVSVSIYEEEDK
jgi:hypothetical protein